MLHDTCDKVESCLRKSVLSVRVTEGIVAVFIKEGHICVHTRACNAENRLRHKGCIEIMKLGIFFYNVFKCHYFICNAENIAVFEINLVLTLGTLMVGGFNFKAHILKSYTHITSAVAAEVNVIKVKVACFVVSFGCRSAFVVRMEKEEFKLRTDVEFISHVISFFDCAFEHVPRVADEWRSVRAVNVANKTCCFAVGKMIPRKNNE